jgi:hypothetical protein
MKWIASLVLLAAGCGLTTMKVAPVKVEPIHMTVDVNVVNSPSGEPQKR